MEDLGMHHLRMKKHNQTCTLHVTYLKTFYFFLINSVNNSKNDWKSIKNLMINYKDSRLHAFKSLKVVILILTTYFCLHSYFVANKYCLVIFVSSFPKH